MTDEAREIWWACDSERHRATLQRRFVFVMLRVVIDLLSDVYLVMAVERLSVVCIQILPLNVDLLKELLRVRFIIGLITAVKQLRVLNQFLHHAYGDAVVGRVALGLLLRAVPGGHLLFELGRVRPRCVQFVVNVQRFGLD